MQLTTTHQLRIIVLIVASFDNKMTEGFNITEIVKCINKERKIEINVFVNLEQNNEANINFYELVQTTEKPKIILRKENVGNIEPLFEKFNKNSLAIVWLLQNNTRTYITFELLDRLLWRIHFKDILLILPPATENDLKISNKKLREIFQNCWSKGFISALLWFGNHIYTYHPYPKIKVVALNTVKEFFDKSHLNNFQQYKWAMPFYDFPNVCYSYTNRQGKLVRTGYFYKWIQLYFQYYNASLEYNFLDMWKTDTDPLQTFNEINGIGFSMLPIFIPNNSTFVDKSNVLYLTKILLMVPNAKEIKTSLYLTLPYNGSIWLLIMASCGMFYTLLYFVQRKAADTDLSKLALQTFSIIMFLSNGLVVKKSLKFFFFQLLFLFTGLFFTNYYTSNLSSLFASRVYEPQLNYFADIGRTNLKVLEHSFYVAFMRNLSFSKALQGRFISGSNNELGRNRLNLNMTYMYSVHKELADFLLFQQNYLKHPIARLLKEVLYYRAQYITVSHRSPLIEHFNRYLLRIRENGLAEKFLTDTQRDGVISGYLKLMRDPQENKSIDLEYLRYAFVIWACGLSIALVAFLVEIKFCCFKRKSRRDY